VAEFAMRIIAMCYSEAIEQLDESEDIKPAEAILLVRRGLQQALEKFKP